MKRFYIKTEATEDKAEMTCCYPYRQWLDLIKDFKESGRRFEAWSDYEEEA